MSRTYLRGEIYYADLDPVVGSEQMGTRPVLILQNNVGNHFARTVIVAPITSRIHAKSKLPTHSYIGMIGRMKYPSVVMLEQLRTLDKRGYTEVPERTKRAITAKSGWRTQSDFLHSRSKRQRRRFYMSRTYLRGEIYYADLDPVVGSEQMGTRPVLILQNNVGNHFARTVIVAPITSRIHTKSKIPTHSYIGIIGRMKYPSVVMLEQLRTLDKRRIGYYIGKLPEEKMQDVTRALCVSLAIRQNTAKGM